MVPWTPHLLVRAVTKRRPKWDLPLGRFQGRNPVPCARSKGKTDADFHSKRKDGESDRFGAKSYCVLNQTYCPDLIHIHE